MASESPDHFTADQQQQSQSSTSSCTLCPGLSPHTHWLPDESSGLAPCCSSSSPTPSPSSVSTSTSNSSFFFGGGAGGGSEGELSEGGGGGMTVRSEERSTVPVVRKPIGTSATGYGVLEEPGRYRAVTGGRATPGKTSEKTMRSTEARPCRTLKEYNNIANYPWTIRHPDGEERYLPAYKNFRLQTPDPERALLDNVISAPPNVTVDASVCENMSWNGGHRCQGGPCPPPYGSLHQMGPCGGVGGLGDSNLKKEPPSSEAAASPSKSGKLKEVFSSFVRSIVPASGRASCRKSSAGSGGGGGGGVVVAEPRPPGTRWSTRRASPPMGGGTAGSPGFDPPPSYERVVKEKKEQENAKKNTPPK